MATYQILYWRKIPAQLKVAGEGKRLSHPLSDAYQVEIDRIAMEEGLEGSDDYLDQWTWTKRLDRPGSVDEVLKALLQELEEEHDNGDL